MYIPDLGISLHHKLKDMRIVDKIAFSPTEPPLTNVLWAKPTKNGFVFYLFDGKWRPMEVVSDKGTPTTGDDTVIDLNNIPSLDNLDEKIEGEVTKQITTHDEQVRDVHSSDTSDSEEYPEVHLFG